MLCVIESVLNAQELGKAREILASAQFVDGKLTAGIAGARVKDNSEMNQGSKHYEFLNGLLMPRLINHPTYQSAAMPLRTASPHYARYVAGQHYGNHVDNPIMGQAGMCYRSDVSITVFLNEPGEYEGGELVINTTYGERSVKLRAGDAILYPSSSLHHVADVTSGQRLVAVIWAQSAIRDPLKRELLFEMKEARDELIKQHADLDATKRVSNSYANLVRMWSEV